METDDKETITPFMLKEAISKDNTDTSSKEQSRLFVKQGMCHHLH